MVFFGQIGGNATRQPIKTWVLRRAVVHFNATAQIDKQQREPG